MRSLSSKIVPFKTKFTCEACPKSFARAGILARHKESVSHLENIKPGDEPRHETRRQEECKIWCHGDFPDDYEAREKCCLDMMDHVKKREIDAADVN